jgi:hypothetical protein
VKNKILNEYHMSEINHFKVFFSSYGGRFSMRFGPTGSQRRGEFDYANLNRRRAATEPGNSEAARPVLADGEGGLR